MGLVVSNPVYKKTLEQRGQKDAALKPCKPALVSNPVYKTTAAQREKKHSALKPK